MIQYMLGFDAPCNVLMFVIKIATMIHLHVFLLCLQGNRVAILRVVKWNILTVNTLKR